MTGSGIFIISAISIVAILVALKQPGGCLRYSFLRGALYLAWIVPQLAGLNADIMTPEDGLFWLVTMTVLCRASLVGCVSEQYVTGASGEKAAASEGSLSRCLRRSDGPSTERRPHSGLGFGAARTWSRPATRDRPCPSKQRRPALRTCSTSNRFPSRPHLSGQYSGVRCLN